SGGGAHYDYDTITVEHVLPQTPPAGCAWLEWFPDSAVRIGNVHTLGNLALLTRKKNSAASNYDFERKKTAYFTRGDVSPFALTTQVLQHATWTPDIVSARQKGLITALEAHWRLEKRAKNAAALDGDGGWRDDVREGLRRLGGKAPLQSIYKEVE